MRLSLAPSAQHAGLIPKRARCVAAPVHDGSFAFPGGGLLPVSSGGARRVGHCARRGRAQKAATVGQEAAAAMCNGPVSPETNTAQRLSKAANCGRVV